MPAAVCSRHGRRGRPVRRRYEADRGPGSRRDDDDDGRLRAGRRGADGGGVRHADIAGHSRPGALDHEGRVVPRWGAPAASRTERAGAAAQAAGVLPPRRRARSPHRRRRHRLRHRLRACTSGRLERTLPLPGRRRAERQRALAARRPGGGRHTRAGPRVRRGLDRHRTHRRRVRRHLHARAAGEPRLRLPGRRSEWRCLAKQIIARHYGRPASKSYFAGCSTGGREAMLVAQRHPTYFDGIVAGAPAMRTNFSGIGGQWVAVSLNQVAPKDASGKAQTRQALERRQQEDRDGRAAERVRRQRRREGRPGVRHDVLQVRSEDARLRREQGGRLSDERAGRGRREGVQRAEGFQGQTGLSAVPMGHRASTPRRGFPACCTAARARWACRSTR